MHGEINDPAVGSRQVGFDYTLRKLSEEVFRVVEWTTLVAVVGYIGAKFDSNLLICASYALAVLLSAYIGIRSVSLVARLRGRSTAAGAGLGWHVLLAAPITGGSIWLIMYMIGYLVQAQTR